MKFFDIFKDNNNFNERIFAGFLALVVLLSIALIDVISVDFFGKTITINETAYETLGWIVVGAFGIAEIGKISTKLGKKKDDDTDTTSV